MDELFKQGTPRQQPRARRCAGGSANPPHLRRQRARTTP